jgi:translation elongation factor EF-G
MENGNIWRLYGHPIAISSALSQVLSATVSNEIEAEISAAIFVINASTGLDQNTIDLWHGYDEFLMPRILVVTGFDEGIQDFDDAVILAKRVLDDVATPVLVLHDDDGSPCALIDLETMKINDYRTGETSNPDAEHIELISDFREEYLSQLDAAGPDGFTSGLLFPAIPVLLNNTESNSITDLGVDIVKKYLNQLPSLS